VTIQKLKPSSGEYFRWTIRPDVHRNQSKLPMKQRGQPALSNLGLRYVFAWGLTHSGSAPSEIIQGRFFSTKRQILANIGGPIYLCILAFLFRFSIDLWEVKTRG